MATIKLTDGNIRQIPEEFLASERGIEWQEDKETHIIPWTAILELIQHPAAPP